MKWPFDFSKTHRMINNLQNRLNSFVIDLPELKSLHEIQSLLAFVGSKDLEHSNQWLNNSKINT